MGRRLHLTRLRWLRESPPAVTEYFPGDSCPNQGCRGSIVVYATRPGQQRETVRYLKCNCCGFLPENKLVE